MKSGTTLVAALLTVGDVVVVVQSAQALALEGGMEGASIGALHLIVAGARALWLMRSDFSG